MSSRRGFLQSAVAVACAAAGNSQADRYPISQMESGEPSSQPPGKPTAQGTLPALVAFGASLRPAGRSATSRGACSGSKKSTRTAVKEFPIRTSENVNVGFAASVVSPKNEAMTIHQAQLDGALSKARG